MPRKKGQPTYYSEHREERIAYAKRYQKEHPDKAREYGNRYYRRNREEFLAQSKSKNRERYYRRKAEKQYFIAQWFYDHPREYQIHRLQQVLKKIISKEKVKAASRRGTKVYRTRKNGGIYRLTRKETADILSEGCFFCGSTDDLTIAHDIPVSRGGNTTKENCFCLCRSCNSKMNSNNLAETISQLNLV